MADLEEITIGYSHEWFLPDGCVVHSFRHSLRDRLRSVECPSDIVDALGGWTTPNVGQKYGIGYELKVKQKWLMVNAVYENYTMLALSLVVTTAQQTQFQASLSE